MIGQSLGNVGNDLEDSCFSFGEEYILYVPNSLLWGTLVLVLVVVVVDWVFLGCLKGFIVASVL
jgi:hypothetical protein